MSQHRSANNRTAWPALPKALVIAGAVLAAFLLYWVAAQIVSTQDFVNSDFSTFWLGGRLSLSGQNPYNAAQWLAANRQYGITWIPNQTYIYPLPLSLLFAPLALISIKAAYITWVWLSLVLLVVSVLLLLRLRPLPGSGHLIVPVLGGIFLFRPVMVSLRNGQISIALLFILVLSIYLSERNQWAASGFVLAFLMLKPQLGVPVCGLVGGWLLYKRQGAALAGLASGGFLLLVVGLLQDPGWIGAFLGAGRIKLLNTFGHSPTIWGLASGACRGQLSCTLSAGGLVALMLVGLGWLLSTRLNAPGLAVGVLVPVALLIPPYLWNYDQVLLIVPITLAMFQMLSNGRPYMLVSIQFLLISILSLGLLLLAMRLNSDQYSAVLSLVCLVLLYTQTVSLYRTQKPAFH